MKLNDMVCETSASYQSPYVSIDVLLTWGTIRFAAIDVRHAPRLVGQSNYTFRKLVTHALNIRPTSAIRERTRADDRLDAT